MPGFIGLHLLDRILSLGGVATVPKTSHMVTMYFVTLLYLSIQFDYPLGSSFSFLFSLPVEVLFRIELKPLLCVQQSPLLAEPSQQPIA